MKYVSDSFLIRAHSEMLEYGKVPHCTFQNQNNHTKDYISWIKTVVWCVANCVFRKIVEKSPKMCQQKKVFIVMNGKIKVSGDGHWAIELNWKKINSNSFTNQPLVQTIIKQCNARKKTIASKVKQRHPPSFKQGRCCHNQNNLVNILIEFSSPHLFQSTVTTTTELDWNRNCWLGIRKK